MRALKENWNGRLGMKRFAVATLTALSAAFSLTPAGAQDLVIGQVASPTSPVTAANAKGMAAGMKVYFDQVNSQGGIHGQKVRLVTKDDGLKPGVMVQMTKEFAADKQVVALAGYVNTGGLTEMAKENVPGQLGIALISPLQGDKSIVGAANIF